MRALNVPNGFRWLYNEPRPALHHRDPALSRLDDGIDVIAGACRA
jgi:hypothetical protein